MACDNVFFAPERRRLFRLRPGYVVLDQHPVIQTDTVITAAPDALRHLIYNPHPGTVLARIEIIVFVALHGFDVFRGQRGNPHMR